MVHRSREVLHEKIRQAHREDGLSGRELALRFKVLSRRTVRYALESPVPPKRKSPPRRQSVLEPMKGFIDQMLREDVDTPAKQRHTIVRTMERLAAEQDLELARNTTVWKYVRKRRPQIRAEALEGRRHRCCTASPRRGPGHGDGDLFADRLRQHRPRRNRGPQGDGGHRAGDAELLDGTDTAVCGHGTESAGAQVISLHARRLPPDPREVLPDMSKYDRLLSPVADRDRKSQKGHGA